jgi:prevent-host-death family protein
LTDQLTTSEVRDQLAEIINRVAYGKERVILTRRGKEVVAVVADDG